MDHKVFDSCPSLKNIYYSGTEAQWQRIDINYSNDGLDDATVHFKCSGLPDVAETSVASFKGASLSLNGIISVNFYVQIDEGVDASVVFHINGNIQKKTMAEATISDSRYIFACQVAAKEMADDITAQIYVNDEPVGNAITYSVQQYCENKLAKDNTGKSLKNLLVAMLNYGSAAQVYFDHHTDDLANAILTADKRVMAPVDPADLEDLQMAISGSDDGIAKSGASLLLEAETIVRYRVQLADGYSIDDYTFQYGSEILPPVAAGNNVYYVDITGIAAKDLDKMYPITIGNLIISYGPMSYVLRQLDNASTNAVVTGLYHYNQMANAYFYGL